MKRLATNAVWWVPIFYIAVFLFLWIILPALDLLEVFSNLVMALAMMVMVRWARQAWNSAKSRKGEGYGMIMVGIFSVGLVLAAQRANINLLRWLNRPDWLTIPLVPSITAALFCIMLTFFLISPDLKNGRVRWTSVVWIGLSTFILLMMMAVYFTSQVA